MNAPASYHEGGIISLRDLIEFVAHVADCFSSITATFPQELVEILSLHHKELESELREKIVGSLVLLKRKDVINSST
jgi:protein SDA1